MGFILWLICVIRLIEIRTVLNKLYLDPQILQSEEKRDYNRIDIVIYQKTKNHKTIKSVCNDVHSKFLYGGQGIINI